MLSLYIQRKKIIYSVLWSLEKREFRESLIHFFKFIHSRFRRFNLLYISSNTFPRLLSIDQATNIQDEIASLSSTTLFSLICLGGFKILPNQLLNRIYCDPQLSERILGKQVGQNWVDLKLFSVKHSSHDLPIKFNWCWIKILRIEEKRASFRIAYGILYRISFVASLLNCVYFTAAVRFYKNANKE